MWVPVIYLLLILIWKNADSWRLSRVASASTKGLILSKRIPALRASSVERDISEDTHVDISFSYTRFEKLLFGTFASAVATEIGEKTVQAKTYNELIGMIDNHAKTRAPEDVNAMSKRMLVRLFPNWLLPAYKVLFASVPGFSAWMNTWVTHFTTSWLMGKSTVQDLILDSTATTTKVVIKDSLLVLEKCTFLETSGCIQTCIHACKVPTQNFFMEEMGLPVTLKPNLTDYSCRFEFGRTPISVEEDESLDVPCLDICTTKRSRKKKNNNKNMQRRYGMTLSAASCDFNQDSDSSSGAGNGQMKKKNYNYIDDNNNYYEDEDEDQDEDENKDQNNEDEDFAVKVELDIIQEALTQRALPKDMVRDSIERLKRVYRNITNGERTGKNENTALSLLQGQWELVYASSIGYFPILEKCTFTPTFELESSWGPLPLGCFKGTSTVESEQPLEVRWRNERFSLFGLNIDLKEQAYKSYIFIYINKEFAVAESSSGSFTLLKRI